VPHRNLVRQRQPQDHHPEEEHQGTPDKEDARPPSPLGSLSSCLPHRPVPAAVPLPLLHARTQL
jgi:hypothetical protein